MIGWCFLHPTLFRPKKHVHIFNFEEEVIYFLVTHIWGRIITWVHLNPFLQFQNKNVSWILFCSVGTAVNSQVVLTPGKWPLPAEKSAIIFPPNYCWTEHPQPLDEEQGSKDDEDEEGEGAPLVQGGEGQGGQEVLRALREAARQAKEAGRGGKSKVCPHWVAKGSAQDHQIRSQGFCRW